MYKIIELPLIDVHSAWDVLGKMAKVLAQSLHALAKRQIGLLGLCLE